MTEIISQKSSDLSAEIQIQRMQKLEKQIWTNSMRLLNGEEIELLSSSAPKYLLMFVVGERFFKSKGVNGIELVIGGIEYDSLSGEGTIFGHAADLYSFHKGSGVIKSCSSSEGIDVHRLAEEDLGSLLKTVKGSRAIRDGAEKGDVFVNSEIKKSILASLLPQDSR